MRGRFDIRPRSAFAEDALLLLARIFLALPFAIFGPMKYFNMAKMQAYIETAGLPGELIWLVIPLQTLGALSIVLGLFARGGAVTLGVFSLVATCLYHTHWEKSGELSQFTKDFAMAGGFIFLWINGPGRLSLDAALRRVPLGRRDAPPAAAGSALEA